jgi:hypothetical protein
MCFTPIHRALIVALAWLSVACGYKVTTTGDLPSGFSISGRVNPLLGSIVQQQGPTLFSHAYATVCADPVYARVYELRSDGTIDAANPLLTQELAADARFSFDLSQFGHTDTVQYLVRAEGCNGDVFARPVTALDDAQDIDYKSTLISQVINAEAMVVKNLSSAKKADVIALMGAISGTSMSDNLASVTSDSAPMDKFNEIFGTTPAVLMVARPEVSLQTYSNTVNELQPFTYTARTFHVDPGYSFVYRWKVDGVVVATTKNFTYTPHANQQGDHQIDYFVGKNDGSGNIDLTKPYYVRSFDVTVNNTAAPVAPDVAISAATPNPRPTNSIDLELSTGLALADCDSFSDLAITATPATPGPMQFTYGCSTPLLQTETISFGASDGAKTLYLWARDAAGTISAPKSVSFILDTTAPSLTLGAFAAATNDLTPSFNFTATDAAGLALTFECRVDAGAWSSCTSPFTTATLSTGAHTVSVRAQDLAGNQTASADFSFAVDTTPPTLAISSPAANAVLATANLASVSLSGTCSEVGRSVSLTSPVTVTTTCQAGNTWSLSADLSGAADGVASLQVSTTDLALNAASVAVNVIKDTVPPTLSVSALSAQRGGASSAVGFVLTEARIASGSQASLEIFNGASWASAGTLNLTAGNNASSAYSFAGVTMPTVDSSSARVRVHVTDAAGNSSSATSSTFVIDSTAPSISAFTLAGGATNVAVPTVSFQQTSSDNLTGVAQLRFSESATYSATNLVSAAATGTFTMSAISGSKTVYLWARDAVGNVSAPLTYSLSLDYGSPPTVAVVSPVAGDGPFVAGVDSVPIAWSCQSTNGLDSAPVRISYSTNDGASFTAASPGWLANNDSASTGSYSWPLPAGVTTFRLLVECKSAAGVVSSTYSSVINTSNWSIFAGDPAYMNENISASLALMTSGAAGYQSMGADNSGNVYFMKGYAMMKVDAQSGLVTRFAGDPAQASCNLSAGQDPLTSANNRIGSAVILGVTPDGTRLIFVACSKVWFLDTATRGLQIAYNGSINTYGFFNRTGKYYYFNANRLYRLDLMAATPTPQHLYGDGTCSANIPANGSEAPTDPIVARASNNDCSESYIFATADDSKLWTGCWNNWGCAASRRYEWNAGVSKYTLASTSLGWSFGDWNIGHCTASMKYPRIWCNSRYSTNVRRTFNLNTSSWETDQNLGTTVFIRYTPTPSGMVSLRSDNLLRAHLEAEDGTISEYQIGGQNIESYGNGSDLAKVAFSAVDDLSYSPATGKLLVRTFAGMRSLDLGSWPTASVATMVWSNAGASASRITHSAAGTNVLVNQNWCGHLGYNAYTISGLNLNSTSVFYNLLGCNPGTPVAHPVPHETLVSGNNMGWGNLFGADDRPLLHTNGRQYFFVKNGSNHGVLYSSDKTKVYWVAGRSGATGHDPSDSGATAATALLSDVRWISQVTTGLFSGDLLILDGYRLRLITITTEATPKIYDVLNLSALAGFPSGSPVIKDVAYDPALEISNGTTVVPGSGKFYFSTSTNRVFSVLPSAVSGVAVTAGSLSEYNFTGTTLTGSTRIALTPAGLLVTQPSKLRILRVAP